MSTPTFLVLVAGLIAVVTASAMMWGWPTFLLVAGAAAIFGAVLNS